MIKEVKSADIPPPPTKAPWGGWGRGEKGEGEKGEKGEWGRGEANLCQKVNILTPSGGEEEASDV